MACLIVKCIAASFMVLMAKGWFHITYCKLVLWNHAPLHRLQESFIGLPVLILVASLPPSSLTERFNFSWVFQTRDPVTVFKKHHDSWLSMESFWPADDDCGICWLFAVRMILKVNWLLSPTVPFDILGYCSSVNELSISLPKPGALCVLCLVHPHLSNSDITFVIWTQIYKFHKGSLCTIPLLFCASKVIVITSVTASHQQNGRNCCHFHHHIAFFSLAAIS